MSAAWNKVRRLENDRVAVGERRRNLPCWNREREVPGRNDADDADRLARDFDIHTGSGGGELLAWNSQSFAGEKIKYMPGAGGFANRLGQRLALLAGEQLAKLLATRKDLGRGAQENIVPFLRRRARPSRKGGVGRLDRGVGLRGVGLRVFAHDVVCVRRVDVASHTRALDPFSGDKILVRAHCSFP